MRAASKITIGVLALLLSACEMNLPRAKTPPAPQPAAAKAEPPPETPPSEPLSIPQTQVQLPQPQPIDPEALATPPVTAPSDASASHQSHRATRRGPTQPATSPAKPEAAETAETTPPAADNTRPRIEPVLPADKRRHLIEEIASRLREVDQMLGRITAKGLSESQKSPAETIRTFVGLARQKLDAGDTQAASGLADRAFFLAQDLERAR
jgi:hypothetical protein